MRWQRSGLLTLGSPFISFDILLCNVPLAPNDRSSAAAKPRATLHRSACERQFSDTTRSIQRMPGSGFGMLIHTKGRQDTHQATRGLRARPAFFVPINLSPGGAKQVTWLGSTRKLLPEGSRTSVPSTVRDRRNSRFRASTTCLSVEEGVAEKCQTGVRMFICLAAVCYVTASRTSLSE